MNMQEVYEEKMTNQLKSGTLLDHLLHYLLILCKPVTRVTSISRKVTVLKVNNTHQHARFKTMLQKKLKGAQIFYHAYCIRYKQNLNNQQSFIKL